MQPDQERAAQPTRQGAYVQFVHFCDTAPVADDGTVRGKNMVITMVPTLQLGLADQLSMIGRSSPLAAEA